MGMCAGGCLFTGNGSWYLCISHLIVRGSLCHGLVDSISARILSLYCKCVSFRCFFLGTSDTNLFDLFGCCHAHSNYASGRLLKFDSVMTTITGITYPQGRYVIRKSMNNQDHIPVMHVGVYVEAEKGRWREGETDRETDRQQQIDRDIDKDEKER